MASCTSCGHQLGVGRFCASCGAPVDDGHTDWRTDTAERPAPRQRDPRTPPAAVAPPPPPRYPLYADEVQPYSAWGPLTAPSAPEAAPGGTGLAGGTSTGGPAAAYAEERHPDHRADHHADHHADPHAGHHWDHLEEERRSPALWILVAALALVLIAAGWWFLVRSDGAEGADPGADGTRSAESGGGGPAGVDVARTASAQAPATAAPNQDVDGRQVSYDASNMLDGVPETAWRAPGDATGMSLTFTLRDPTRVTRVGLVNGYAKTATSEEGTFDWYLGNRRVKAVVWSFDDGTKVRQQLVEDRELQTVDVPGAVTTRVVVRLVRVTAPGEGRAGRDYTAVSEVALVGVPS